MNHIHPLDGQVCGLNATDVVLGSTPEAGAKVTRVFKQSFNRKNLYYDVRKKERLEATVMEIVK